MSPLEHAKAVEQAAWLRYAATRRQVDLDAWRVTLRALNAEFETWRLELAAQAGVRMSGKAVSP